jgi:hypothetical protein
MVRAVLRAAAAAGKKLEFYLIIIRKEFFMK